MVTDYVFNKKVMKLMGTNRNKIRKEAPPKYAGTFKGLCTLPHFLNEKDEENLKRVINDPKTDPALKETLTKMLLNIDCCGEQK